MENIKNGKTEIMGVSVDIASILGEKVVDQVLANITPEEMDNMSKAIQEDLFQMTTLYNTSPPTEKRVVRRTETDNWGKIKGNEALVDIAKKSFNAKVNKSLQKRIDEIIASEDYSKKIDEIAQEVVDYSTEGYKEDMKIAIRERMVNSTTCIPYGLGLKQIINQEIQNYVGKNFR